MQGPKRVRRSLLVDYFQTQQFYETLQFILHPKQRLKIENNNLQSKYNGNLQQMYDKWLYGKRGVGLILTWPTPQTKFQD